MQFITDLIITILSAYLALTNSLATSIENFLPEQFSDATAETEVKADTIATLSSAYQTIPKILIENAAYQNAAISDATEETTHASAKEALVNIFCTYKTDTYIRATTGTGYFIDRDGVILTNAHVAQFLLLEGIQGDTRCIIRTGTPARDTYEADLLYISPAWIQKNAQLISQSKPQGTGERDYALLYVTGGLNNKPMPRYFPALSIDTQLLTIQALNTPVYAAGYPAETLFEASSTNAQLIPKQATTSIVEMMTFGSNYADLFTIAGSDIGEQGSSGGPVVDTRGKAIGLISTKGDDGKFGKGSLRAITLSYIDRTIREETGFSLQESTGGNLPFRSKIFKQTMVPFLEQMLRKELEE